MSTSTAELPTTDATTVDHAAEPQADLWTSDSEREAQRADESAAAPKQAENLTKSAAAPESTEESESAAAPDEESAAAPVRDETGKFKPRTGKPRNDPQARVEAATRKEAAAKEEARKAREEAAAIRAELDALKRQAQPSAPVATLPPAADVDSFWQDPLTVARQLARKEAEALLAEFQQRQAVESATRSYVERVETFKADHPDFDTVVAQAPTVPYVVLEAVRQSPLGPQIAYDLGAHPEDAAQLARECATLSPDAVSLVRRFLEARVTAVAKPDSASPPVRPSAARPPINRVGGTASITPADPEDLEFGPEYIRRENAREKKQREAGRW